MPAGKVYLVGAGPGDPGLITLKGVEAIREADCVIYDFLANARLLEHARKDAETVYVGKKGGSRYISQDEITDLIIKKARRYGNVVRLKGGDPFIFGRGGEEVLALVKAGIPFEVVPGVTSATAVPAYAGIPLSHRDHASSITFLTGQESPRKKKSAIAWDKLSMGEGTLVFLMGWKNISSIIKKLMDNGKAPDTPTAMIRWGSMAKQTTVIGRLDNIVELSREKGLKPPVITVVGNVVNLRKSFNWFETKPLFGKNVLVTRTLEQAGAFSHLLNRAGAEAINFPTIKIAPPASYKELDRAIGRLGGYDWAIFTSVNTVKYFFDRLGKLGKDVRELKGVRICAIGPMTANAVKRLGIRVDLTPREYRAEAIIEALGRRRIKGKKFLLPRALKARELLPEEIKRLGGRIDVATAYRTLRPRKETGRIKEMLKEGGIDVVTFTSSSTVTNFVKGFKKGELGELLSGVRIACIGPITADTARGFGLAVDIMPGEYTVSALTEAMAEYYKSDRDS
ncbi:MAG: uroporphyrinogen-III C-methyltransferase [Thermodesulfobacteriota bacterium]